MFFDLTTTIITYFNSAADQALPKTGFVFNFASAAM